MPQRRTLLIALATAGFGSAHAAATVGQPVTDFAARDAEGKEVRLSQFKGKHVVLEWMSPSCPFVRKHYNSGNMPTLQKEAGGKGVVWLSVYSNDSDGMLSAKPAKLVEWMRSKNASPAAILVDGDGKLGKSLGARTTPHMYIVGPTGTLLYAGGIDSIASTNEADIAKATNFVRQGLSESLSGKPLTVASSRPYGCMIKYK